MSEFLSNSAYFGVLVSLVSYWLGAILKKKFKSPLINPLLISIVLTIPALLLLHVLFHEVLQRAKEAGGRWLHRRKSGASSGGGLHVGSLYAYVRRYACRVRRSLFSSGLEREQRREI